MVSSGQGRTQGHPRQRGFLPPRPAKRASSRQERIKAIIQKENIRVIGPNALGVFNTEKRLDSFFVSRLGVSKSGPGRLSIVSQSGAITVILMEALARRHRNRQGDKLRQPDRCG